MKKTIKGFREQFIKCHDEGMYKPGPLQSFKDNPHLLPHPVCFRAVKAVQTELKKNPDAGLTPLMCLRFGGECSSVNPDCMLLRGYSENEVKKRGKKWHTLSQRGD